MVVKIAVNINNLTRLARQLGGNAIGQVMEEGGKFTTDLMRARVHVVTGELHDSIDYDASSHSVHIGSTAEHGIYEVRRRGEHDYATEPFNAGYEFIIEKCRELLKQ